MKKNWLKISENEDSILVTGKVPHPRDWEEVKNPQQVPKGRAGVYILYDDDSQKLKVGESTDLQARLQSHFSGKEIPCQYAKFLPTDGFGSRRIIELMLIAKFYPKFNKEFKRHDSRMFLKQQFQ